MARKQVIAEVLDIPAELLDLPPEGGIEFGPDTASARSEAPRKAPAGRFADPAASFGGSSRVTGQSA